MSAVTVKKPHGCGDEGPPEPLSPAAAPLSCQDAVESENITAFGQKRSKNAVLRAVLPQGNCLSRGP